MCSMDTVSSDMAAYSRKWDARRVDEGYSTRTVLIAWAVIAARLKR